MCLADRSQIPLAGLSGSIRVRLAETTRPVGTAPTRSRLVLSNDDDEPNYRPALPEQVSAQNADTFAAHDASNRSRSANMAARNWIPFRLEGPNQQQQQQQCRCINVVSLTPIGWQLAAPKPNGNAGVSRARLGSARFGSAESRPINRAAGRKFIIQTICSQTTRVATQ